MAKLFILLSTLLSLAASNPITVPPESQNFHSGQSFIPFFRQQLHHYHQQHLVDLPDQQYQYQEQHQSNINSDYGNSYSDYEATNSVNPENEANHQDQLQSSHEFTDHPQLSAAHDYSAFTNFNTGQHDEEHDNFEANNNLLTRPHYVQSVPVSEHVEVTRPVAVPVYKEIGIPVPHPVKIRVPHPVAVGIPQPYPVAVPVAHPVPIQIVKTITVPVEKKVPYPVEKHIPVPIEKPVPIHIEKHIPVPVYKPYPIKVPVYKTIYHHVKEHQRSYDDDDD